jgi:hypothetical protein
MGAMLVLVAATHVVLVGRIGEGAAASTRPR